MTESRVESLEWCMRCARRVRELDVELSEGEALEIAKDFSAFERTAKMEPEAAADFVHEEMARPEFAHFERRSGKRSDRTLIMRHLERTASPADASWRA